MAKKYWVDTLVATKSTPWADLHEVIRGMPYDAAIYELDRYGITQNMCHMLQFALVRRDFNRNSHELSLDETRSAQWPCAHTEGVKTLHKYGLVSWYSGDSNLYYWLTRDGIKLHDMLTTIHNHHKGNTVLPKVIACNALFPRLRKLIWSFKHRREDRHKRWIEQFNTNQEQIEAILEKILTSPVPKVEPTPAKVYWTEEMQRAQNDLYWMSDCKAFWLNPRGPLADPTPAPKWWSRPPVSETDDIVEASLLPRKSKRSPDHAWERTKKSPDVWADISPNKKKARNLY